MTRMLSRAAAPQTACRSTSASVTGTTLASNPSRFGAGVAFATLRKAPNRTGCAGCPRVGARWPVHRTGQRTATSTREGEKPQTARSPALFRGQCPVAGAAGRHGAGAVIRWRWRRSRRCSGGATSPKKGNSIRARQGVRRPRPPAAAKLPRAVPTTDWPKDHLKSVGSPLRRLSPAGRPSKSVARAFGGAIDSWLPAGPRRSLLSAPNAHAAGPRALASRLR
jgi:hypothetical protein